MKKTLLIFSLLLVISLAWAQGHKQLPGNTEKSLEWKLLAETTYDYNDSVWVINDSTTYTYNNQGYNDTLFDYTDGGGNWINNLIYYYTYDNNGNVLTLLTQKWNTTSLTFVNYQLDSNQYHGFRLWYSHYNIRLERGLQFMAKQQPANTYTR